MQREQLTEVILRLLEAWGDPLSQLYQTMAQDQNQDFNHYSSEKALEVSDMVNELRDGVTKMADKVKEIQYSLQKYFSVFLFMSDILHVSLYIPVFNFSSVHFRWSYWECLGTQWVTSLLRLCSPLLPFLSTNEEISTQWITTTCSTASAETPTK